MVQLRIVSGVTAGTQWVTRRLPVQIGRSPQAHLRLTDSGVWDDHARIALAGAEGLVLEAVSTAPLLLNGEPIQRTLLRNGDIIEIGSARLQFFLSPVRQRALSWREALTWVGIASISLGQIALVYLLLRS